MATVAAKLMTADAFYEFVHRPENSDRLFELERGEVVEMALPGKHHGFVCGNVAGILRNFAIQRSKGYVCTNDSGVIVERDPDTVRGPDVSFYDDDQDEDSMDRKYTDKPPRLVAEVISPTDRQGRVDFRVSQFLKLGIGLVWVVDPDVRSVTVYRPSKEHYVLLDSEQLTGDEVLPDFRCRVAEFFTLPGQTRPKLP